MVNGNMLETGRRSHLLRQLARQRNSSAGTRGLVLQDRWCDPAPCDCRDGSPHGQRWELSCLHPPPPRPLPCQPQRWWQQRAATAVAAAATDGSGSGALTSTGRLADTRVAIRRDGNPHRGEWAMPLPGVTGCALEFYSPSFPCAWTSLRRGLAPVRCPPAATPSPSFRPPTGALSA